MSNENCRGGYYSDTYNLCIFTQKSELKYIPVYTRQEALNICYAKNATLPYSIEHVHALEELHLIRNEIGKHKFQISYSQKGRENKFGLVRSGDESRLECKPSQNRKFEKINETKSRK